MASKLRKSTLRSAILSGGACRERRLERQRQSLEYLDIIQRALVSDVPVVIGDLSVSVACSPAEGPGAGGGFYDVFHLGEGHVGLVLGEATGDGHRALGCATLARYTLRALLEKGHEPRAVLKLASSVLADQEEDGPVPVAVAVFDPVAGTLTYALAGHPPPLLLGAGLRSPLSNRSSPPLGSGLPTGLRQATVSLTTGATVCFFSRRLEAPAGGGMFALELGPAQNAPALLVRVHLDSLHLDEAGRELILPHSGDGRSGL